MILGMSNTYQQLVTSLNVDEIRWVLSKRGDSRIGTNSPSAINHKRSGKLTAWLSWILLISTSLVRACLQALVVPHTKVSVGNSLFIFLPTPSLDHPGILNRLKISLTLSWTHLTLLVRMVLLVVGQLSGPESFTIGRIPPPPLMIMTPAAFLL